MHWLHHHNLSFSSQNHCFLDLICQQHRSKLCHFYRETRYLLSLYYLVSFIHQAEQFIPIFMPPNRLGLIQGLQWAMRYQPNIFFEIETIPSPELRLVQLIHLLSIVTRFSIHEEVHLFSYSYSKGWPWTCRMDGLLNRQVMLPFRFKG